MEELNKTLFLWLNASATPNDVVVSIAQFCAGWLVYLVPILLILAWLKGCEHTRKSTIIVTLSVCIGLCISYIIGIQWPHPRPFVLDIGHQLAAHAPDASFPSDHLTFWWSATLAALCCHPKRKLTYALVLLGIPVAWSRIYLGVHWPFDMFGAFMVGAISAGLAFGLARLYIAKVYYCADCTEKVLLKWLKTPFN